MAKDDVKKKDSLGQLSVYSLEQMTKYIREMKKKYYSGNIR